jgi:hypothetical protein
MALTFRDAPAFWRETLAVTVGALACGAFAPFVTTVPLDVAAGSAALLGGSIGAALTRTKPVSSAWRMLIGSVGGTLAALGSAALATRFGLGGDGVLIGGALGALTIGSLLGSDDDTRGHGVAHAGSLAAVLGTGLVGVLALQHVAAFSVAEGASRAVSSSTMAGAFALWVAAAAGLRRLQKDIDPIFARGANVLDACAEPVRAKVQDALSAYADILDALSKEGVTPELAADAKKSAVDLMQALLETAGRWKQIERDVGSPRLAALDEKIAALHKRTAETTDGVTLAHLARASQALHAQKAAVDGLRVGLARAEAALDAHIALLERLRLAVAQHRATDRERLAVELSAVADQVTLLSDDLESLTAAIREAEAFSDRRLLADVERVGRRALDAIEAEGVVKEQPVDAEHAARR